MPARFAYRFALAAAGLSLALIGGCSERAKTTGDNRTPMTVRVIGPVVQTEQDRKAREDESQRLKQDAKKNGSAVWRSGDALIIDTADGVQHRYIDSGECIFIGRCRRWYYQGAFNLITTKSPETSEDPDEHPPLFQGFYWLHEYFGEGDSYILIDRGSGEAVKVARPPVLSPDQTHMAIAGCDGSANCDLQIWEKIDWDWAAPVIEAPKALGCCDIVKWESPDSVLVRREVLTKTTIAYMLARIEHGKSGKWTLKDIQEIDGQDRPVAGSIRPLRSYTLPAP